MIGQRYLGFLWREWRRLWPVDTWTGWTAPSFISWVSMHTEHLRSGMPLCLALSLLAVGCATPRGFGARAGLAVGDPSQASDPRGEVVGGVLLSLTYRIVVVSEGEDGMLSPVAGVTVRAWDGAALQAREAVTGADGSAVLVLSGPLVDAWALLGERVVRIRGPQVPDRFQAGTIHVLAVIGG